MVTVTKEGPLTVAEEPAAAPTPTTTGPPTSSTCAGAPSTRS